MSNVGLFGPVSDIFGFDDIGQMPVPTDPLSAANAADTQSAMYRLSQYQAFMALISTISDAATKQQAMDIVNTNWYRTGVLSFLGIGGSTMNLTQLAPLIQTYVNQQSFVHFTDPVHGDFSVNRTNENRFTAFVQGMSELEKFLGSKIILPTQVQVNNVDNTAQGILNQAQAKAQLARISRSPQDAILAQALADSASANANAVSNTQVKYAADQLSAEMAAIVAAGGAGAPTAAPASTTDYTTYLLIGGGVLVVGVTLMLFMSRKSA